MQYWWRYKYLYLVPLPLQARIIHRGVVTGLATSLGALKDQLTPALSTPPTPTTRPGMRRCSHRGPSHDLK